MLNDYMAFYRNQSQAYGGTYIDMRAQYLKEIPDFRGFYPGNSWMRAFMRVKYSKTQGPEGGMLYIHIFMLIHSNSPNHSLLLACFYLLLIEHPNGNGSDTGKTHISLIFLTSFYLIIIFSYMSYNYNLPLCMSKQTLNSGPITCLECFTENVLIPHTETPMMITITSNK
jgi:hypothetical protein